MSNLYKRIEELCAQSNLNITQMCKNSGVPRSTLSDYKAGRIKSMSIDKLQKIAEYFGVSVDYLMGFEQKEKTPTLSKKDERDIARDLEHIMEDLNTGGALMFDGDPMTDEAKESVIAAMKLGLEAAKLKNKARFTPKKYREKEE